MLRERRSLASLWEFKQTRENCTQLKKSLHNFLLYNTAYFYYYILESYWSNQVNVFLLHLGMCLDLRSNSIFG